MLIYNLTMINLEEFRQEYLTSKVNKKMKIEVGNNISNYVRDGIFEGDITSQTLSTRDDLKQFKNYYACKYIGKYDNEVTWNDNGRQLQIGRDLIWLKHNNFIVDLFEDGIKNDIELIITTDLEHHESIILDGVHRITTLYFMYLTKKESLDSLIFREEYKIKLIDIRSKIASKLFPYDFKMLST